MGVVKPWRFHLLATPLAKSRAEMHPCENMLACAYRMVNIRDGENQKTVYNLQIKWQLFVI